MQEAFRTWNAFCYYNIYYFEQIKAKSDKKEAIIARKKLSFEGKIKIRFYYCVRGYMYNGTIKRKDIS